MNYRLLVVMYAALILGPIALILGTIDFIQARRLLSEGRVFSGKVVDSRTLSGRNGSTTYQLTVIYRPTRKGPRYQKDFRVPDSVFHSVPVGGEIPVRVSPDDPEVSMIGDTADAETEKIAIGGGLFLFGLALLWWRRRKLAQLGKGV